MTIEQLINKAYIQVGDTSHVNYTPYQFLEYYNEGNQLLGHLINKYFPDESPDIEHRSIDGMDEDSNHNTWEEAQLVHYMVMRVLGLDVSSLLAEWDNWMAERARFSSDENVVVARGYWNDSRRTDYNY